MYLTLHSSINFNFSGLFFFISFVRFICTNVLAIIAVLNLYLVMLPFSQKPLFVLY